MGNQPSTAPRPRVYRFPHDQSSERVAHTTAGATVETRERATEPEDSNECRACTPELPSPSTTSNIATTSSECPPCYAYSHSACPLNRAELGRAAWAYLHTLAAYYPSSPSPSQQSTMREFLHTFSATYPCGYCADRTNEELVRNPPRTESQRALTQWMCEVHNEVNERLNKPIFDCKFVEQRWKTGPPTGECQ